MAEPRLWEHLMRPGATFWLYRDDELVQEPVPAWMREVWSESVPILADQPAGWYAADVVDEEEDAWTRGYGPLRAPFDKMLIEWPASPHIDTGGENIRGIRDGVFLGRMSDGTFKCHNFMLTSKGAILTSWTDLEVDELGELALTEQIGTEANPWGTLTPMVIAIGLMNCRNVEVRDAPAPRVPKKSRRPRLPHIAYKTIAVPAPASASRSERAASVGSTLAHHLVRGHFKTFSEDAPLFGKKTGTFWWGWQTRGSKTAGIVKKQYSVSEPE